MNETKLEDYKELEFSIDKTYLDFDILEKKTVVRSRLDITRLDSDFTKMRLDGVDLKLTELRVNGELYSDYTLGDDYLDLSIDLDKFTLEIEVEIDPFNNLSCEGFYKSGNILCTQNEAEGFRKITYYFDRPDSMSVFTTKITADKKLYPYLLSNGNKVEESDLGDRHTCTWIDPHKKPCYLYAVVAGDLGLVSDNFVTSSGRDVKLEIYVDHGNEDKCEHAMESLKNSMKWDEDKYGLEYDLDIYMIVAVDSFNMGAMENKGLNIFNSNYVLAKKETATDANFQDVEAVIGHEYFHNWTGNRVTCKNWFQLTLKEGLTVFRDQEFSADMLSRPVKRIEDVKGLRSRQFSEDSSGLSHPIKPKSYVEMNNFYTSTVYEKGAEVIRMIETLIGKDGFRKGMDLYFKRHDGQAVTTEDFISAMSDANDYNLDHFKVWYDQNGTPVVNVKEEFSNGTYTLNLEQSSILNNDSYDSLVIPLKVALFERTGKKLMDDLIVFDKSQTSLSYSFAEKPVLSLNRNFTSPVILKQELSVEDLLFLMKYDDDEFNKFEACQLLYKFIINKFIAGETVEMENFFDGFKTIFLDDSLENAFKAYALAIPSYQDILSEQKIYKIEKSQDACLRLKRAIADKFQEDFIETYKNLKTEEFCVSAKAMGDRALKNLCLSYISEDPDQQEFASTQFKNATNMTDELSALKMMYYNYKDEGALSDFYDKWKEDTLVIQKWFSLQALNPKITVEKIAELEKNEAYDQKVPNLIRSLVGRFILDNTAVLSTEAGFDMACRRVAEIDKLNPQVASRLAKGLSFVERLDTKNTVVLVKSWQKLKSLDLSKDVQEVLRSIKLP